jgi:growth hormone-inducible transmembrane protein
MFNPIVQDRIRKTLMYFGCGLAATGLTVGLMRSSMFPLMHPWMLLFGSIGFLIGTMFTDYQRQPLLKHLFWGGFVGCSGLALLPLIQMASLPVIYDAMFATGITVGGLGLVAYNAPSEQFLMWGGALGMGCGAMLGISIASMLWPNNPALWNLWLYGGLVLFSAFVLYDVQKIIHCSKTHQRYDPIN